MSQVKTFGRYNLIRKVAQGGMAEIFLAKFQGIGGFEKKIIIKRILPRFSENQEFIKMLIHEAKTAVQLHHQNIVQIYDLGKVRDTYYISMEYIRGKDLRTVLNRLKSQGQQMPRELAVFIAREICKGLDYAHNITDQHGEPLNLVHRDISPPNILLSLEGEVKIIDFGIAKATSQATDTQAGVFKGKFAYMAPEQAMGLPVDRRADIFATGLILWESLTTRKLLEAESDILTLERAKKIDAWPIPFNELGIPEQMETVIRKALKQDRNVRYQSAGEMARDLTIYLNLNYPGFSETDLADFLRNLFNLDKRRTGASDVVTHGQGERSLTGSDFFRALAQPTQDVTDPSVKIREGAERPAQNLAPGTGAVSTTGTNPGTQPVALAAGGAQARRRPAGAPGESEFWSLENDIKDEIEVYPMGGGQPGQPGAEGAAGGQNGWVSVVAEDYVQGDGGSLHPVLRGALSSAEGTSQEVPLTNQEPEPLTQPVGQNQRTRPDSGQGLQPGTHTGNGRTSGGSTGGTSVGRGSGVWVAGGLAGILLLLVISALVFPNQMQALRESLGLARKAQVVLSYQPADAEVLVNGVAQPGSASPLTVELALGQRHQVVVRKDGFLEQQATVDLVSKAKQDPLAFTLMPALPRGTGKIQFEGLLADAVVYVDDRPTSSGQWTELPTGRPLNVKVVKEGYLPFTTQVNLGADVITVKVVLEPAPVPLIVTATPVKASVSVDGRKVGESPFRGEGYVPGKAYKLEVSAPGYKPYTATMVPNVGTPLDLRVSLAPDGRPVVGTGPRPTPIPVVMATPRPGVTPTPTVSTPVPVETPVADPPRGGGLIPVQIFVRPWADIYIDNRFVGRSPVKTNLKEGRHSLRLVNPDMQIDQVIEKEILPVQIGEVQKFAYELDAP